MIFHPHIGSPIQIRSEFCDTTEENCSQCHNATQAQYHSHELTRLGAIGDLNLLSTTLFDSKVDLNPHQVDAALFAIANPLQKGVILADEVELSKTIEAGLVLCQKWAERRRKLIIVTPAHIRK